MDASFRGPPSGVARPSRRDRGQHFLARSSLATRLVREAGIGAQDRVVEFGAGRGVLIEALARPGAHILAVEPAPSMIADLTQRFVRGYADRDRPAR